MCGLMGALINLNLQNLGILYLCILTWQVDVWCGVFLGVDMVRDPSHDGVGILIKQFTRCEQLNAHGTKLQNAEDVVNFFCVNLSDRS
jgi:hypothetical protein